MLRHVQAILVEACKRVTLIIDANAIGYDLRIKLAILLQPYKKLYARHTTPPQPRAWMSMVVKK